MINHYCDGRIGVQQIKASNKLAPKKTVSVPKLELMNERNSSVAATYTVKKGTTFLGMSNTK